MRIDWGYTYVYFICIVYRSVADFYQLPDLTYLYFTDFSLLSTFYGIIKAVIRVCKLTQQTRACQTWSWTFLTIKNMFLRLLVFTWNFLWVSYLTSNTFSTRLYLLPVMFLLWKMDSFTNTILTTWFFLRILVAWVRNSFLISFLWILLSLSLPLLFLRKLLKELCGLL